MVNATCIIFAFIVAWPVLLSSTREVSVLFKQQPANQGKETYLWMSQIPNKRRLCERNRCHALTCKMYQLPVGAGWPEGSYTLVSTSEFNHLKRWCDWERHNDIPSKTFYEKWQNFMKNMLIYPGTNWCGFGNRAKHYEDLGVHSAEDSCCRSHDMCPVCLPAGSCVKNIGTAPDLCNNSTITMSHCDCDLRFLQCLTGLKTTTSSIIAYIYFNMLAKHCFAMNQYNVLKTYALKPKATKAAWKKRIHNKVIRFWNRISVLQVTSGKKWFTTLFNLFKIQK